MADETEGTSGTGGAKAAAKTPPTDFIVLEQVVVNGAEGAPLSSWAELGTFSARAKPEAIKQALTSLGREAGTFVAVPARSWAPASVKTVPSTKLVIE